MTGFDPAVLDRAQCYRLLIGSIVPRPIAWVTTRDGSGAANLAPFSFFNGVTATPPTISIAIAHRSPVKDTLANLRANRDAVVHLAPPERLADVHQSGADYAHAVSEIEQLHLETVSATRVAAPRLTCCAIALECRLVQEIPVGLPPSSLCLLEVVYFHVDARVARADGMPDPHRHAGLARLGDRSYLHLGRDQWQVVDMPVAEVPPGLGTPKPSR